jgi:Domain of unknown function (DUF4136)
MMTDASKPTYRRAAASGYCLGAISVALIAGMAACSHSTQVTSVTADPQPLTRFHTFVVSAPAPRVERVAVAATNDKDRGAAAIIDMDPMLATSLVGRAIRQDLVAAFERRGYQHVDAASDFQVAYYAGTGQVVDTRAYETGYYAGHRVETQTYDYPAGTIIVDVVNTRSDSLVWRGTGLAPIPSDPEDYARAIRRTVDKVVAEFPKAPR